MEWAETVKQIKSNGVKVFYEDSWGIVINADCREILPELPKVDLVLTDPPYGINKAEWDGEFDISALDNIDRLTERLALMPGIWNLLKCPSNIGRLEYRWTFSAHLINGMTRGALGFGNWIPCLVYASPGLNIYQKETDCYDVIVGEEKKPNHPSPKPVRAISRFIERLSGENTTVLDPFLGSGTTAVAAKKLNRHYIGIEISEKYCEIAALQLSQDVMVLDIPDVQSPSGGALTNG
jgi:DNA modification methylase